MIALSFKLKLVLIGIAAVAASFSIWLARHDRKVVHEYRSRVEATERKIDAKAQTARKRAASDADRLLPKYYRD